MEACCCGRLPPVLVAPVAAAGDRRSAISSSSSSTGYGRGRGRHCLPMWAGLRWTYGPGSFHGSRLRVARTTSSSKRAEMGCLSFEIRSAMLAKIQSGSASPSCVAATASECLKSFIQGTGGMGTAPGSKDVAKRLLSVIMRAGHSKKRAKGQGSGGRIEGGQGKRRLDVKRGRNSAPGQFRNDGQPSGLKSQEAATKDKYRNGAPDREVASDSGKRTRGPKPRVRVTLAGRPVEVVEKEALGRDVSLWTSDPGVRHPDDYYKYGPFGPHAWKGLVVGTPRKGTFADELAVFFSSVKNQEELEEIEIVNSIVGYENKLRQFDESISTQYYFAFVRSTYKATTSYQMPWEEWTLVAQIAIESADELDKWRLGFQLDRSMRDNLTRCVAWYRPDLIYVRRPSYQVRFEPQHEFLTVLVELLNPDNDAVKSSSSSSSSSKNPYFERMCEILGVRENDDEEQIGIKFKNLSEEMKSHCLEHVLGMHPVELLTPFTRRAAQEDCAKREGQGRKINGGLDARDDRDEGFDEGGDSQYGSEERSVDSQVEEEEEEDFGDEEYGEDSDEEGDDGRWDGEDWENEEWKPSLTEEDVGQTDEGDSDNNMEYRNKQTAEGYSEIEKDSSGEKEGDECTGKEKDGSELLLKAAVRPYTYADLIKEIIFIRRTLLQYPALR